MNSENSKRKEKLFYITSTALISLSTLCFVIANNNSNFSNNQTVSISTEAQSDNIETDAKVPQTHKLNLSSVGDIMVHQPQLDAQLNKNNNTYSFDNNFKYIKPYIESSDLSLGNFETTLAGKDTPYSSYPSFNSPDEIADALKSTGFDILSTINNHSFDKGDLGFFRTLDTLNSKGFDTVGTIKNKEDKNYLIKEVNNISLGITSFSYGDLINESKALNGIKLSDKAKDKANIFSQNDAKAAFDLIDKTLTKIDSTDMQILIIHWGEEYQREPNEFQKELAQLLCDRGVDIIIGSHPHVVQPVEMISSSDNSSQTLVVYSLGNFISNQRREYLGTPYTEDGLLVNIEISKNTSDNLAYISNVTCIPTWVNKYSNNGKQTYEVIPLIDKKALSDIPNIPLDKAKASYSNTISQIKKSDLIRVPQNPFI